MVQINSKFKVVPQALASVNEENERLGQEKYLTPCSAWPITFANPWAKPADLVKEK